MADSSEKPQPSEAPNQQNGNPEESESQAGDDDGGKGIGDHRPGDPEPDDSRQDDHARGCWSQLLAIGMPTIITIGLMVMTCFLGWFFYARMSTWLVRGNEIGKNLKAQDRNDGKLPDCFDKQFDDVLLLLESKSTLNGDATTDLEDDQEATVAPETTEQSSEISSFEELANGKIDLFINRLGLYEEKSRLLARRNDLLKTEEADNTAAIAEIDNQIKEINESIQEIDSTLKGLGIPRISIPEFLRINNQMDLIQKRIYTHYNVVRLYYALSTALAVSASVSLLGGSIILFLITKDGWKEVSEKQRHVVSSLFIFAGFYIFCLNLPAVLSADRIYESNLSQYVGYTNLEGYICTVLATERFYSTPENPDVITTVEFNRLIHSIEREMQKLNTHNLAPNLAAIERFTFTLDSLELPRKQESTTE
jgi:hypothetical protein